MSDNGKGKTIAQPYEMGQRLYCDACKSEIEVISPCTCEPSSQVFRCCGREMRPNIGTTPHVNVEA